ncbi:C-factor-like isoform X2 [Amphibalanus amphitrite]|nr:C-factor-like isoform X2 [Amphibalanus amphitrite]XP_043215871.1 C-factor-like isoform X2 [Amphibalanus amphitrite]XP_043215872.1 C-factor-like isoform X2 [Amphibalanus amphitrite]XP_043215874.1 C-factor-like isoform X2 [Amphibalanus amphitrite]
MATVLIQGASRGLGLQFARALAARDSVTTVLATCRRPEQAEELRSLPKVQVLPLDVTSETSVAAAAQQAAAATAGLDLLVNCSAILHPSGRGETSLRDVSLAGLQETFNTNTFGPLLVAKHFAPLLQAGSGALGVQSEDAKQRHAAVLVNMTAKVGSTTENVLGGWYSYRMSKAALNMATKNLSIELGRGRKKVLCVGLHPGTVDTDLSRPYHKNVPAGQLLSPERSVSHLLAIVDRLTVADSGRVFVWSGEPLAF